MKKILTISIILVLLCSTFGVLAQAQSNGNVINSQNLTVDQRIALAKQAYSDYISGKSNTFVIPGATVIVPPQTLPSNRSSIPIVPNVRSPDIVNFSSIMSQPQLSQVSPLYTSMWLPVSGIGDSPTYSNTFVQFGGSSYGGYTISISAWFNDGYPNSLSYLGQINQEFIALHLWGNKQSDGSLTENDIVLMRGSPNTNDINFWYYDGQNGGYKFAIATIPQTHKVSAWISAVTSPGARAYDQIQVSVYDATSNTYYTPPTQNTISTQIANNVDVALECTGNYNNNLNNWRVTESCVVKTINFAIANLYQYGHVAYIYTPNPTSPIVRNAYYFDPYTYQGVPNGWANIFLTRYATGGQYPPHP